MTGLPYVTQKSSLANEVPKYGNLEIGCRFLSFLASTMYFFDQTLLSRSFPTLFYVNLQSGALYFVKLSFRDLSFEITTFLSQTLESQPEAG